MMEVSGRRRFGRIPEAVTEEMPAEEFSEEESVPSDMGSGMDGFYGRNGSGYGSS